MGQVSATVSVLHTVVMDTFEKADRVIQCTPIDGVNNKINVNHLKENHSKCTLAVRLPFQTSWVRS